MEKHSGGGSGFSGEKSPESADNDKAAVDLFYEKLAKLNESSGLSLLFNLRKTMLDLHLVYKEVIKLGGYYQVTKKGKWEDVASVSNPKSGLSMSADQLQNLYKMFVFQYELMYGREKPGRADVKSLGYSGPRANPSYSFGKRKHCEVSYPSSTFQPTDRDGRRDNKDYVDGTWQEIKGPDTVKKNSTSTISPKSSHREFIADDSDAPLKPRTAYHIFLRLETQRLKMVHGESSGNRNLREMANAAWRHLPEKDKLPYIEASKMDKERYDRETAAYTKLPKNRKTKSQTVFSTATPRMLNFSTPAEPDDVYRVSLQDDSESLHSPDESMIELAIEVMKNSEFHDSIFQFDWDNGSPNTP